MPSRSGSIDFRWLPSLSSTEPETVAAIFFDAQGRNDKRMKIVDGHISKVLVVSGMFDHCAPNEPPSESFLPTREEVQSRHGFICRAAIDNRAAIDKSSEINGPTKQLAMIRRT